MFFISKENVCSLKLHVLSLKREYLIMFVYSTHFDRKLWIFVYEPKSWYLTFLRNIPHKKKGGFSPFSFAFFFILQNSYVIVSNL